MGRPPGACVNDGCGNWGTEALVVSLMRALPRPDRATYRELQSVLICAECLTDAMNKGGFELGVRLEATLDDERVVALADPNEVFEMARGPITEP